MLLHLHLEVKLQSKLHQRGSRACGTWPNVVSQKFPSGLKNCVWLNRLKISARNWKYLFSDNAILFENVMSH